MKNFLTFLYLVGMTIIGIFATTGHGWAGAMFVVGLVFGILFFSWSDAEDLEDEFNRGY